MSDVPEIGLNKLDGEMSSKYGHERRNRREKVWKEATSCVDGKELEGLWSYVITSDHRVREVLSPELSDRMCRQDLMEFFETEVRRWRFTICGYKFMFPWGMKLFADANGLPIAEAKGVFRKIRAEAEGRLLIVKQRIRRTGFHTNYERDEAGNLIAVHSLNYAELPKFLQRDSEVYRI